jgi:hypothetical protein
VTLAAISVLAACPVWLIRGRAFTADLGRAWLWSPPRIAAASPLTGWFACRPDLLRWSVESAAIVALGVCLVCVIKAFSRVGKP